MEKISRKNFHKTVDKQKKQCYYVAIGYPRRVCLEDKNMSCCKDKSIARLNKIEGQIRGVKEMISSDRYCEDVIIQLSAINAAITATAKEILYNHISHCVVDAIKAGDDTEAVQNLLEAIDKFAKMK